MPTETLLSGFKSYNLWTEQRPQREPHMPRHMRNPTLTMRDM